MIEDIRELHEHVLYPCVRIRAKEAGGSGTVIYSRQCAAGPFETYVLTNWHVVEKSIAFKEEWDHYLQRNVKKEVRQTVMVDRFRYEKDSIRVGEEGLEADIVAWDKEEDLALLQPRLRDSGWPYIAQLFPLDKVDELRMFMPIRVCGCSLLHEPFSTLGEITSLNDEIDNRRYFMGSTLITFGNSGGAVFTVPDYLFLGVPSRVSIQGFSSPANFMGYFIPPQRWTAFLKKHHYDFILTGEDSAAYHKRRERRAKQAEKALEALRQGHIEDDDLSGGQTDDDNVDPFDFTPPPGGTA